MIIMAARPVWRRLFTRYCRRAETFTNLLALIDKSGYTPSLSSGGYWTFFAPNDAAFQKYFTANGTTLDKILADTALAGKIVRYALVYNAFQTNHLADYQSPLGYVPNLAFKRRTTYYDGFMYGPTPDGANGVYVTENRNFGGYAYGDNNNKYIPYFYSTFMTQAGLSATDYNYFFPNSTYSGFNVANASVVNKDILAENGVIHEIDQVVLPLPNLDQKLASNTQYSVFRNLYEQYLVTYVKDANYTRQYNTVTLKTNNVYVKTYSSLLTFALGNESFNKLEPDDSQINGYTLFAPTNTVLQTYLNNTILEFYGTLNSLPQNILADLLNSFMFPNTVWPSKFKTSSNAAGEPARFDPTADVVDKQFCSNGLFYGVSKVQQANNFSTIYARVYLDPNYSIMTRLIDQNIKAAVTSPGLRYTMFLVNDATFRAAGFDYNGLSSNFTQTVNGVTTTGGSATTNLQRILNNLVYATPNNDLNDLSADGIAENIGGEYLRWHNNAIYLGGSVELNKSVPVTGSRDYSNGRVYFIGSLPDLPSKTIANDIAANAGTSTVPGPYYDFYTYLVSSDAYNAGATEILNVSLGVKYTVFVPTRAAMQQAVVDGYLPGTTTVVGGVKTFATFTYNPTDAASRALVTRFIQYHVINGSSVAPDGKKGLNGATFPTLLKNVDGTSVNVYLFNSAGGFTTSGTLRVEDTQARFANVLPPNTNPDALPTATSGVGQTSSYLGNYTLLHQIDTYLRAN